jgi:sucrose-phosphate synthase
MRQDGMEYGILVDPSSPEDIAAGLMRVLGPASTGDSPQGLPSEDAWARFRTAGMQRVESRYTWKRTAEGYSDTFQRLSREPTARRRVSIPRYFTKPTSAVDILRSELSARYFGGSGAACEDASNVSTSVATETQEASDL